jgi:hypothetical protein
LNKDSFLALTNQQVNWSGLKNMSDSGIINSNHKGCFKAATNRISPSPNAGVYSHFNEAKASGGTPRRT